MCLQQAVLGFPVVLVFKVVLPFHSVHLHLQTPSVSSNRYIPFLTDSGCFHVLIFVLNNVLNYSIIVRLNYWLICRAEHSGDGALLSARDRRDGLHADGWNGRMDWRQRSGSAEPSLLLLRRMGRRGPAALHLRISWLDLFLL